MQKIDVRKCLCGAQPDGLTYYSPSDGYQRGDGYFRLVCPSCGANVKGNDAIDCCIEWNHLMRKNKANRSEWIKMRDRLPEIGKHVMFFEPGPNEQCRVGCIEERDVLSGPPILEVRDLHSGSTMSLGWFTHWMPLPDAPKGEN